MPRPGSPTTVTSWTELEATRLVEDPLEESEVDLAPDEGHVVRAGEIGAEAGPCGLRLEHPDRRFFPLSVASSSSSYSNTGAVAS